MELVEEGREGEHCIVLSSSSLLGKGVLFMSGQFYNLTSRTWISLPAPPVSFNLALVSRRTSRRYTALPQVGGLPVLVGLAERKGNQLVGDSSVWQLQPSLQSWLQVMWCRPSSSSSGSL